ncbi:MAG TPA: YggT family protein [Candidatus Solibacter sp.]|jgi:YggT family protein|nr:YggT family protein [Candidatus Solibacter sp.]
MSLEIVRLVSAVIQLFVFLIVARAIGSFFIRDWSSGIARFLWDVTEPVLAPVRRLLPPFGGIDFSPLVVIILLQVVSGFLQNAAVGY